MKYHKQRVFMQLLGALVHVLTIQTYPQINKRNTKYKCPDVLLNNHFFMQMTTNEDRKTTVDRSIYRQHYWVHQPVRAAFYLRNMLPQSQAMLLKFYCTNTRTFAYLWCI